MKSGARPLTDTSNPGAKARRIYAGPTGLSSCLVSVSGQEEEVIPPSCNRSEVGTDPITAHRDLGCGPQLS